MHFVQPLSVKAAAPRAVAARVVAAPHYGRRQQRPLTEFDLWRSQSSYTKLSSISPRDLQRSVLPIVSHIPHATKDDATIADAQLASAAEAFMPEVWPDFSKKNVDSDIEENGKSELIKILKEQEGPRMLHLDLAAVPGEKLVDAFMADVFPPYTATNLAAIIDAYNTTLDNLSPGQRKPVIVIDEANALQFWKKGYDANSRDDQVVGDLTSAEAFVYLCGGKVLNRWGDEENWPGLVTQSAETLGLGMTPEDWKNVWSVCGGNIHLLKVCVGYAEQCNSWEKGVAKTLSKPRMEVAEALEFPELIPPPVGSDGPRIWEAEHYKAVLRLIAANPYHAVRRNEVHAALEKVGDIPKNATAAEVLLSMVEFNAVSLRPYSMMAEDIPREAFSKEEWGVEEEGNVVTMPSPAHLAAVLLLETSSRNKMKRKVRVHGLRSSIKRANS
ncbi:hypothetical protein KSW81_006758 [Nannochloris sp. 'desiccata']|nr:hypothetical protein KSW81_006758 [Chlorella desiccata (nom. nud.)]